MIKTPSFLELAEKQKQLETEMREYGKQAFDAFFKAFFTENPNILGVKWTQYIPGFNDGDPCVFSLGEIYFKAEGVTPEYDEEEYDQEYDEYDLTGFGYSHDLVEASWQGTYPNRKYVVTKELVPGGKACIELESALESNKKVLELAFGENAKIICYPDKIVVEDYDCGY